MPPAGPPLLRQVLVLAAMVPALASGVRAQRARPEPLDSLEGTARRDSCDPEAHYGLALAYLRRNRYDAADSALQRAVAVDPQFAPAHLALGLIQAPNERYWERLRRQGGDTALLRERVRRDRFAARAYLLDPFVDMRVMGMVIRGGRFPAALRALMDGNYAAAYLSAELAARYYDRPGGRDSLPGLLLWVRAMSAARADHERVAITDVETLLRLSLAVEQNDSLQRVPLATNDFRYVLAALHQRLHENTLALRLYEQVLGFDIGNYMAHVQMARIAEAERDWFNAVRERRLAIEANPEDVTLRADLGATLLAAGRWEDAEQALLDAEPMSACYFRTARLLGIAQQHLDKREAARASLARFLARAPQRLSEDIADARRRLDELR